MHKMNDERKVNPTSVFPGFYKTGCRTIKKLLDIQGQQDEFYSKI